MRPVILASLLAAACAVGCGSETATPFSPSTLAASGFARGTSAGSWVLSTTLTSVAGPLVCFDQRGGIGARSDRLLGVGRDGDTITLLYEVPDQPHARVVLVGTIRDGRFEATASWVGYQPCHDARVDYTFESYVTGTLSEDGRSMTASERWTYRLSPGDAVVLWFAWEAERP
jgi:hypothetical protein